MNTIHCQPLAGSVDFTWTKTADVPYWWIANPIPAEANGILRARLGKMTLQDLKLAAAAPWNVIRLAKTKLGPAPKGPFATALLAVAAVLFIASSVGERLALSDFRSHVIEMAGKGGGVLFVVSPADCQSTTISSVMTLVADSLQTLGIEVLGLVVDDDGSDGELQALRAQRAQHLDQVLIDRRGMTAYLGRLSTPLALGVGPRGYVWVIEHLSLANVADVPGLVGRLQKAVGIASE